MNRLIERNYRRLNIFGIVLFVGSLTVCFTPFLEFFPGIAPNGYEVLFYLVIGYAVFSYSIVLLFVINFSRSRVINNDGGLEKSPTSNWFTNIKIFGTSIFCWVVLLMLFWSFSD
jgi:hypothetical protein